MMPIVRSAACAGAFKPESAKGLAAAPPRKVLREIERMVMSKPPACLAAGARQAVKDNSIKGRKIRKSAKAEVMGSSMHHPSLSLRLDVGLREAGDFCR